MLKEKNPDLKNMYIGIGVIFLYLVMSSYPYEFLGLFGISYNKLSFILKQVYLIFYQAILLFIIFFIYRKDIINNFKNFISNITSYLKKYIKYWFLILILMIISNYIVSIFTTTTVSQNQKAIIDHLKIAPAYIICVTILIAPMLEELVFRISFKKIFPYTKALFIFFSGVFFGFIHVISSLNNLTDLLFIIPYSIPGFIFAYLYNKSENIFVPISLHFIHNLIIMIVQIILIIK